MADAVGEGFEEMGVEIDIGGSGVDEGLSSILLEKVEIVLNRLASDFDFGQRDVVLSLPIHTSNINELLLEFLQMEILVPVSEGNLPPIVGNANGEDHVLDSVFLLLNVDQSGRRIIVQSPHSEPQDSIHLLTVELSGFLRGASKYVFVVLILPFFLQLVLEPEFIHGVVAFILRSLSVPLSEETFVVTGFIASPVEVTVIGLEIMEAFGVD